jgi:hypothetical protein
LISSNQILSKLSPFKNYRKIVTEDQSVNDIINGILDTHEKYKEEYDKISEDFIGSSELETAKNIWNFLHSNVPYYIESTKNQTLRSPSAIVAMPGDCKSYALFANGIFDSLNRKGIFNTPLAYRFADYRGINEFQHVFAVLYPGTNKEIWIDPVLPRFNEKKQPTSYKDKKIKMALIAMSGVSGTAKEDRQIELKNFLNRLVNERDKLLNDGVITPGSSKELEYKVAINKVTKAMQAESINGISKEKQIGLTIPVVGISTEDLSQIISIASGLFPGHSNWWKMDNAYNTGDYQNAANYVVAFYTTPSYNTDGVHAGFDGDLAVKTRQQWLPNLYAQTKRQDILNIWKDAVSKGLLPSTGLPSTSIFSTTPGTTNAGMNMYVTLGLVGAGIYLLTKMKK